MNSKDNLNPYAAPQSDVTPPKEGEPPMPRPASTKWLLGFMWFFIIFAIVDEFIEHQRSGQTPFSQFGSLRAMLSVALIAISLIAFHLLKRKLITYLLGILYLLLCNWVVWLQLARYVRKVISTGHLRTDASTVPGLITVLLLTTLLSWLFYRFTFGQASRRFYRLTQK